MIIELEGKKLDLNMEKTAEHYKNHLFCDCAGCRNFNLQAAQKYPLLKAFLEKLGADILKPKECEWFCDGDNVKYYLVQYVVCGKILEDDNYEIDVADSTFVNIILDNQVTDEEESIVVSVEGITLPYMLEEPLEKTEEKKKGHPVKESLKFLACFVGTFIVIYLLGFFGGWKLFESGDPILMEIGVSVIVSLIVYAMYSSFSELEKKIKELENRIESLEKKK